MMSSTTGKTSPPIGLAGDGGQPGRFEAVIPANGLVVFERA
jgi:hypothetical protein